MLVILYYDGSVRHPVETEIVIGFNVETSLDFFVPVLFRPLLQSTSRTNDRGEKSYKIRFRSGSFSPFLSSLARGRVGENLLVSGVRFTSPFPRLLISPCLARSPLLLTCLVSLRLFIQASE